jgi:small conductance mechanosensitive channel
MEWWSWAIEQGANALVAIVILVVGWTVAGRLAALVRGIGARNERLDRTLFVFLGSLARYGVIAITVVIVLDQFGVETTSLIALLGAAGLAVGLALQGTLANLAAGVMLLAFRPFQVGDYVEAAGHAGTVEEIGLFTTHLVSPDNVLTIVPNGDVWASAITNYSAKDERRVDLVFGVSYASDLQSAEAALREVIAAEPRIKQSPAEPFVAVTNLGASSVDFTIRVWCDAADYWALRFDLIRKVKETFDERSIEIPFPTTTIVQASD